jgi:hypothetical protein
VHDVSYWGEELDRWGNLLLRESRELVEWTTRQSECAVFEGGYSGREFSDPLLMDLDPTATMCKSTTTTHYTNHTSIHSTHEPTETLLAIGEGEEDGDFGQSDHRIILTSDDVFPGHEGVVSPIRVREFGQSNHRVRLASNDVFPGHEGMASPIRVRAVRSVNGLANQTVYEETTMITDGSTANARDQRTLCATPYPPQRLPPHHELPTYGTGPEAKLPTYESSSEAVELSTYEFGSEAAPPTHGMMPEAFDVDDPAPNPVELSTSSIIMEMTMTLEGFEQQAQDTDLLNAIEEMSVVLSELSEYIHDLNHLSVRGRKPPALKLSPVPGQLVMGANDANVEWASRAVDPDYGGCLRDTAHHKCVRAKGFRSGSRRSRGRGKPRRGWRRNLIRGMPRRRRTMSRDNVRRDRSGSSEEGTSLSGGDTRGETESETSSSSFEDCLYGCDGHVPRKTGLPWVEAVLMNDDDKLEAQFDPDTRVAFTEALWKFNSAIRTSLGGRTVAQLEALPKSALVPPECDDVTVMAEKDVLPMVDGSVSALINPSSMTMETKVEGHVISAYVDTGAEVSCVDR